MTAISQQQLQTSELVVFNFKRPARARLIGGGLWLVEIYDAVNNIWVWQTESDVADQALEDARRLSLGLR